MSAFVLAGTNPRTSLAGTGVTVRLRPTGPTSILQGTAFGFSARAINPSPSPVVVNVVFRLSGPGAPGTVDADSWAVTVPGLGQVTTALSLISSQWFAEIGDFSVVGLIDGLPAGAPLGFQVLPPAVVVPRFQDVTALAGLNTTLPGASCWEFGSGAAWGDVDGDGDPDLFVPVVDGPAQLWINDASGHFTEEAAIRGVDNGGRRGMGAVFADYDNDGDEDLYVVNDGTNRLYQNDGTGHFVDVAAAAHVADSGPGPSASWGDYDGDGLLDLYVTNYISCTLPWSKDVLYHNEGDGTFSDQTGLLERDGTTSGSGYEAAWFDYDGDGDPDLYLANDDVGIVRNGNHLWRNDGPHGGRWSFTDVSVQSGMGFWMNSMGIAVGDFDGDLKLDVAVSNIDGNVLARNNGDGTFTDLAVQDGIFRRLQQADVVAVTWGLGFQDLNLDGLVDLYVAAGDIYGTVPQPNEVFVNSGGSFLDLSAPSGGDTAAVSRGIAFADFDGDGRMDVYVVNQRGSPVLYRNVTPLGGSHWLEVRLTGTVSARDACGATLILTAGGVRQIREVFCGSVGLSSGSERTVHFGLGPDQKASSLVIEWPSGTRQVLRDVSGDQLISVTEPGGSR
jgi:hypothetical protein